MLALTIRQPWAHAILHDGKHVENRSWRPTLAPPFRMAIHAGRGYDANAYPGCPGRDALDLGAIVGEVDVVGFHHAVGFEEREEQCEKAARRLSQGVLDFGGEAS